MSGSLRQTRQARHTESEEHYTQQCPVNAPPCPFGPFPIVPIHTVFLCSNPDPSPSLGNHSPPANRGPAPVKNKYSFHNDFVMHVTMSLNSVFLGHREDSKTTFLTRSYLQVWA